MDAPDGPTVYWDGATFSDDVAKALIADRVRVLGRFALAQTSDPASDDLTIPLAIELTEMEAEIGASARGHIQNYLDGDYEPKVKKIEKCHHGIYGYEACENCIDEHFIKLLGAPVTAGETQTNKLS